jgi:ElaB/YqjD/DUF883 family membrane-anchored ribosome-binding protein
MSHQISKPQESLSTSEINESTEARQTGAVARDYGAIRGYKIGGHQTVLGRTKDYVRQHPGEALFISCVIGFTLALLLPGTSTIDPD